MKNSSQNKKRSQFIIELTTLAVFIIFWLAIFNSDSYAQGLSNNGAVINISNTTKVTVNGGSGIGNFSNFDYGVSTGTVANNGEIYVSGNWTNNSAQHIFNSNNGTVILNGSTQVINGISSTWFNNLNLEGNGTKILSINSVVGGGFASPSGVLSLGTEFLDLNANMLTVNNPSANAITRTSGFIISETNAAFNPSIVEWNCGSNTGNYVFPFGSSHGYTPVGVTKNSTTNSNISASTRATASDDNLPWASGVAHLNSPVLGGPGEVAVTIDRWYYVSASSPVDVDLDFTYSGIENTTTFSPTGIFAMQNWTGTWQPPVGSGAGVLTGTATVSATSQTIGPVNNNWVLTNTLSPLPIQLISFDAKCEGDKKVKVTWQTASEQNLKNYEVQRSADALNFQTIATIAPQANIAGVKSYNWIDFSPLSSTSYYRLKEIDMNGMETVFNAVAVKSCDAENDVVSIYAAGSVIYFNLNSTANNSASIEVFDAAGKKVLSKTFTVDKNVSAHQIETSLAQGIYFVTCKRGTQTSTRKIALNNF